MRLNATEKDGCLIVKVENSEIDYTVSDEFKQKVVKLIKDKKAGRVLLNLEDVSFMDSKAIGAMVGIRKAVVGDNGVLGLCCLHPHVNKVISVVTVNAIFDIYQTESEALKAM